MPSEPEVRRDLTLPKMSPEHVACNVVLQLHGHIDPDNARTLSDRVVWAVSRARARGHAHPYATEDEMHRAKAELHRRGWDVPSEDVGAVLNAALIRGWGQ